MNNKITFDEAIRIMQDLKTIFNKTLENNSFAVNAHALHALAIFNQKYNGKTSIKEIKNDLFKKHKIISKEKLEVKISKLLITLEDAKLVLKTKDKTDKRIIIVEITEKGKEELKRFKNEASKLWEEM